MKPTATLWEGTAGPGGHLSEEAVDADCDVAIVGAGFTGLRTALSLAERGSRAIVLDTEDVGWGASGRNGGQVNPMLPVKRPEDLRKAVGDRYFEHLTAVSLDSADELFDLVRRHGIDCDARQNGWLRVDHCPAARNEARTAAEAWNAFGAGFEFVDGDDLRRLSGSPAYRSGVLSPRGGAVQPLSLARGIAGAARKAGARIFRKAQVTAVERAGRDWLLRIGSRTVRAQFVVLGTNGYTDGLLPGLARSILPVYPVQIASDALSDDQIGAILPDGHTVSDTRRMIMYARRGPGNRMVFGGIGFRKPFGGLGGRGWLLQDVARVFPSLRGCRLAPLLGRPDRADAGPDPPYSRAGAGHDRRSRLQWTRRGDVAGHGPGPGGPGARRRTPEPAIPDLTHQTDRVPGNPDRRVGHRHVLHAPAGRSGVSIGRAILVP